MAELNRDRGREERPRTTAQLRKNLTGDRPAGGAARAAGPVRRYKLLAGQHVALDPTLATDERGRGQSRIYRRGDVVESAKDLVLLFGSEKFQLIGERQASIQASIPAPQGQMSSGFQVSKGEPADPLDGRIHQVKAEDAETQARLSREGGAVPVQEGDDIVPGATEDGLQTGDEAAEAEGGGAEVGDDGAEPGSDMPRAEGGYDLDAMSLRELKELAEANEINTEGVGNSKEKVKERLRAAGLG